MNRTTLVAAVCLTALLPIAQSLAVTASTNPAAKDYGKLSFDGASAMQDITLARLALSNGRTADADRLVDQARQALHHAATDDTVYMKAEDALHPPKGSPQTMTTISDGHPIAWLPVDGDYVLSETLTPTPSNAQTVHTASSQLKNGDPKAARETLKVAAIDGDYTLGVAPLVQSTKAIDQAATQMQARQYYAAGQTLRGIQDSVRYDSVLVQDLPKPKAG